MSNGDFMFSESEFAAFVGKSQAWARRERRLGRSPAYVLIGRTPKYSREDVSAWMQANRVSPGGRAA
jgi:hypothetical protein